MALPDVGDSGTAIFRLPGDDGHYKLTMTVRGGLDCEDDAGVELSGTLKYISGSTEKKDVSITSSPPKKKAKSEKIGYIKCYLVDRTFKYSYRNLYHYSDAISDETFELAKMIFSTNGEANNIDHPALAPGTEDRRGDGSFLHIYLIEVHPDYHGKDLGLMMVHELMGFARDYWTFAALVAEVLDPDSCKWKGNDVLGLLCNGADESDSTPLTDAQRRSLTNGNTKLARHFGRMGFVQAGSVGKKTSVWFITSAMRSRNVFSFSKDRQREQFLESLIPKDIAENKIHVHDIAVPKEDEEPSDLDKELCMHVVETMAVKNREEACDVDRLKSILRRGGNVDAMIHVVCQYFHLEWLIDLLISLGGSVDAIGRKGMRPLHSAIAASSPSGVRHLLAKGANPSLVNALGETPLQYAIEIEREEKEKGLYKASFQQSNGTVVPMNKKKQEDATAIRRLLESWKQR